MLIGASLKRSDDGQGRRSYLVRHERHERTEVGRDQGDAPPGRNTDEVLYNASVYRDAGGQVLGVFAAARDVTDQNQAHREIARQHATALDRLAELEQFHRLAVGRELKMIELKKEIEYLRRFGPGGGDDLGAEG